MRRPITPRKLGEVVLDEACRDLVGDDRRMLAQVLQKRNIGGDALNAELGAGAIPPRHRTTESRRARMHDQLGNEWIEPGIRCVPGIAGGLDAHAAAIRHVERGQGPAGRQEGAIRLQRFQVDAQLDREAERWWHVRLT